MNTAGAWAKRDDAKKTGDRSIAILYQYSSAAFFGTAATSGLMAIGTATETLIARGVGGALARSIALRVGANGTLALVGGTALTVSGVGLVLLGAGIAFQIGAIALTPTALQRWISRSYFGKNPGIFSSRKRDDMFKKGDWNSELSNFNQLQKDSRKINEK